MEYKDSQKVGNEDSNIDQSSRLTANRRSVLQSATGVGLAAIGGFSGQVAAEDTGNEDLQRAFGIDTGGTVNGLVADDSQVYYTVGKTLTAVDGQSGEDVWETTVDLPIEVQYDNTAERIQLVQDQGVLLALRPTAWISKKILAYDTGTGDLLWDHEAGERIRAVEMDGTRIFIRTDTSLTAITHNTGDLDWRIDTIGSFSGDLQMANGTLLTFEDGETQRLVAIDPATGDRNWEVKVKHQNALRIDAERAYIATDDRSVDSTIIQAIALEDGTTEWTQTFESAEINDTGYGQFHVLNGTVLIILQPVDEYHAVLHTIDGLSGETQWELTFNDLRTRLTVTPELAVIAEGNSIEGEARAYNLETGDIEWSVPVPGISGSSGSDPIVEHNGIIYHRYTNPPGARIWAVDIESSEEVFDRGIMGGSSLRPFQEAVDLDVSNEFIDGAHLIPENTGTLERVSSAGEVEWAIDTGGWVTTVDRDLDRELTVGLTNTGDLHAVDETTGEITWSASPTGVNDRNWNPVVSDGIVISTTTVPRSDQSAVISAYNIETGDQKWETTVRTRIISPVVVGGNVITGTSSFRSRVIAYDLETGSESWQVNLEDEFNSQDEVYGILASETTVQVITDEGDPTTDVKGVRTVSFNAADGSVKWTTVSEEIVRVSKVDRNPETILLAGDDADRNETFVALQASDGAPRWVNTLDKSLSNNGGLIGDRLGYLVGRNNDLQTVDARTGEEVTRQPIDQNDDVDVRLAVGRGNFYVYAKPSLEAFTPDGNQATVASVDNTTFALNATDDRVYLTTLSEGFIGFIDGTAVFPDPPESSGPTVADYANSDGTVTIIGLRDALGDWRNSTVDIGLLVKVITAWRSGDPVD
ncbi:hypothetical protein CP556_22035 [Natrinema sp. CBA1119]|uniref:outer membrane protein assembly factor BamB family protein n=1 Tax=Natrinema sp. CBA1119 TaxID=1608465 RepID=UPI000BF830F9|nr:PQQ-binding-like beta-propeller repeat protein [Natrinema sp. CBA1119]PGF14370.1 hypothetical protein CP556_22035 [Natrinema sp. CBA1119]